MRSPSGNTTGPARRITNFHQMFHLFLREGPTGFERFETAAALEAGWSIERELQDRVLEPST